MLIILSCKGKQEVKEHLPVSWNMPENAFYVKGIGSGVWCQAEVHRHKNSALIRIYDPESGIIIAEKTFILICKLEGNPQWIEDPVKQIDYFDGKIFQAKLA